MRPFPKETFQGEAPIGPELLLRKLRGENVDWATVPHQALHKQKPHQALHKQEKRSKNSYLNCDKCKKLYPWTDFSETQRALGEIRQCQHCLSNQEENLQDEFRICAVTCKQRLTCTHFSRHQWRNPPSTCGTGCERGGGKP